MAFFDNFSKKVQDVAFVATEKAQQVAAVAGEKANAVADKAKTEYEMASERRSMDKNYRAIGEWFISEYTGEIPDAVKDVVAAVIASKERIGELEAAKAAKNWAAMQGYELLAMLAAAVMGAVFSLLLSFASINLRADQTIGGTALNLMGPALGLFFVRIIANQNTLQMQEGDAASWVMIKKTTLGFEKNADLGFLGNTLLHKVYLATYICIILFIVLSIILYKTKFGLRLRACGENPQAADSLGINVYKMRWAGVLISGMLGGLGGIVFITAGVSEWRFEYGVAGFGFLALAVMIFGNWKPVNIAVSSLLFGLFKCIAASYASIDINGDGVYMLAEIGISAHLYRMLPYIVTLLVLAFTSKSSRAPKAEGIPYDKGSR